MTKDGKTVLGCLDTESVVIPEGVTRIEMFAFSNCRSLKSVAIPESVTEIEDGAFTYCSSLKEWKLSEKNTHFTAQGPFLIRKENQQAIVCLDVESVTIPDDMNATGVLVGIVSIGRKRLKEWKLSESNPNFTVQGPLLMSKDGKKVIACLNVESATIPEGVEAIGPLAFLNCNVLTSVTISDRTTEIEDGSFIDCPNLTIHAPKGSKAEEFAEENQIPFEVTGEQSLSP